MADAHADARTDAHADARAYEAFAREQDPLDIEAATWVARQRNGLDAEAEAELQAWLDADPRHQAAYDDMQTTVNDVSQVPQDDVASLKATLISDLPPRMRGGAATPDPHRSDAGRRRWWAGLGLLLPRALPRAAAAVLVLALLGGGWMGWERWQQWPSFERDYATARGRQLIVSLPDADARADAGANAKADAGAEGSTMHLDSATEIRVRLYRDRREVQLTEGQAMFAVHADAQRPFEVRAGAVRVSVVGTRFSVRHTRAGPGAGQTIVSVEEGRVQVTPAPSASASPSTGGVSADRASVALSAGQSVMADDGGHIGRVASVPPSAIAPWRHGRVSFEQTPLAQAIAEFERYGPTGLVVSDPAVAALPVGGSYSLGQFQRFVDTLPQVLPVRLVRRGERIEVVAQ